MLKVQRCPWTKDISFKTLPKTGYIVLLGKQPIAAGFLRRVEGGYAQLDTFVSNPYYGSKLRHEAMELIVNSLLDEAKSMKLHGIIAITQDTGILKRSEKHGFAQINQILIGKSLI